MYANIDMCAREPKSEQEMHVCISERLLQHVYMCKERQREGVEMIRSVMLQMAGNVMQHCKINFS